MQHPWTRFPAKQLRFEVEAMQESVLETLQALTPAENLVGVYAKGSGVKVWDSPLDYVPELSDVDVQVLLKDESAFKTLEGSIEFQERLERLYKQKVPRPLHYPRPQILLVKERWKSPTFNPSPESAVKVLYGKPYAEAHPLIEGASILETDLQKLLQEAEFLQGFPEMLLDKPGKYIWLALRNLSWRVGPSASRVLTLLGADFQSAWGQNRTEVISELHRRGELDLKDCYERFYSEAWEFFIEGNPYVARRCLMAGYAALERALEIALEFEGGQPQVKVQIKDDLPEKAPDSLNTINTTTPEGDAVETIHPVQ